MREKDVPQDPSFYRGIQRACYATDDKGRYVVAKSRGWTAERIVTEQALLELEKEVEDVRQRVLRFEASPLAYHLATHQMTPKLFAQHVGISTWRVKRHLKPRVFNRLSDKLMQRYAACLNLAPEALRAVPETPGFVFIEGAE